jgi:hypothetical protein
VAFSAGIGKYFAFQDSMLIVHSPFLDRLGQGGTHDNRDRTTHFGVLPPMSQRLRIGKQECLRRSGEDCNQVASLVGVFYGQR